MSLFLGVDTGGTYTDAVILSEAQGILGKAKALTTKRDLAIGVGNAMDAALAAAKVPATAISLVSLSTTLATNALVEGQGARAALVLIGFGDDDIRRAGLAEALRDDLVIRLNGGHDAHGNQVAPLDLTTLSMALDQAAGATAFAVASMFSVRNPAHEQAACDLIRQQTGKPVTCSHELSAQLNGPKRALTCLLNARLVGMIAHLIDATEGLMRARGIDAPLMVVRGDGALIAAEMARTRPIETILSGPAASIVGAAWLSGVRDAIVSDIGGTTTDVAILRDGRPRLDPQGAMVGGFRTMVQAVAMRTIGLGGDSEVGLEAEGLDNALTLGPRRVIPVSLLAQDHPDMVHEVLDRQLRNPNPGEFDGRFAMSMLRKGQVVTGLPAREAELLARLTEAPQAVDRLIGARLHWAALQKLVGRGLAAMGGLTPSDAAHVLDLHHGWDKSAAEKATRLFQRRRNGRGEFIAPDITTLAQRIISRLHDLTVDVLLETAFAEDGLQGADLAHHPLTLAGLRPQPQAVAQISLRLGLPLVGLGASAPTYYGPVAERLGTTAILSEHAGVANAIGAVVGHVRVQLDAVISSPAEGRYRLHWAGQVQDFTDLALATETAKAALTARITDAARAAGAEDAQLHWTHEVKTANIEGKEVFIEAQLTVSASGRPRLNIRD